MAAVDRGSYNTSWKQSEIKNEIAIKYSAWKLNNMTKIEISLGGDYYSQCCQVIALYKI